MEFLLGSIRGLGLIDAHGLLVMVAGLGSVACRVSLQTHREPHQRRYETLAQPAAAKSVSLLRDRLSTFIKRLAVYVLEILQLPVLLAETMVPP